MFNGVPHGLDFLSRDHGLSSHSHSSGNHDGEFEFVFLKDILSSDQRGLGIERVKNRLHHQNVCATLNEGSDLVGVIGD